MDLRSSKWTPEASFHHWSRGGESGVPQTPGNSHNRSLDMDAEHQLTQLRFNFPRSINKSGLPSQLQEHIGSIFAQGCTVWNTRSIAECWRALIWVGRTVEAIVGDLDSVDEIHQHSQNSPSTSSVPHLVQ